MLCGCTMETHAGLRRFITFYTETQMHASQVFDDPGYYLARCLTENGTDFDREVREFRHCVTAALRKCHAPIEMQIAAQDKTVDISMRNDIHSLLASCSYGSMCERIKKLEQRLTRIEGYLSGMDPEPVDYDEQDRMAFESEKLRQGLEQ